MGIDDREVRKQPVGRFWMPEPLESRLLFAAASVASRSVSAEVQSAVDSTVGIQAVNVKTINVGDTVVGAIAAGDSDELRFTATAGQRVYLDVMQLTGTPNAIIDFALRDPGGNPAPGGGSTGFNGSPDNGDFGNAVILPTAGQYKLTVVPRAGAATNYTIKLGNAPLDVKNVALGDAVTGSLEVPGATDEIRFNATAGQRVYLDVTQLAGPANGIIDFALLDPGGNAVPGGTSVGFTGSPNNADFANAVTLSAAGQYKLVVDARASATTDYVLKVVNAPLEVKNIALGDAVTASLEPPGSTDEYDFNVAAGQRVYLDVSQLAGTPNGVFDFALLDPGGNVVPGGTSVGFSNSPDAGDFANAVAAPTAGKYKLIVDARGDATANYALTVYSAPLEVKNIAVGDAVTGSLEVPGGTDEYDFTATAGQRVYVDVTQLTGTVNGVFDFALLDPAGNVVPGGTSVGFPNSPDSADFGNAVVLPTAGKYKLIVDARGGSTANYALKLYNAPLEAKTVPFGSSGVVGSIEVPGATDEYDFNATAGQRLLLDVTQLAGPGGKVVDFVLIDPHGAQLYDSVGFNGSPDVADRSLVDLNLTGQYKLIVDARGDGVANYQLDLLREGKALVSGTAWTAGFRNAVKTAGLGTAAGYDVRSQGALKPIPWSNLNQVSIVFDTEVNPKQSDLVVKGRLVPNYPVTGFSYDAATLTATWTLGRIIANDALTIKPGHGIGAQVTTLPADVDQSAGAINATDLVLTRNHIGHSIASPGTGTTAYKVFGDVNADGVINAADLVLVRNRIGTGFIGLPLRAPFSDSAIDGRWRADDVLA